jgi:hypothetical protein
MSSQINPYAPPQAEVAHIASVDSEAEAIRREHIKHESSIKSVGVLYYIGGGFLVVAAIGMLATATVEAGSLWIGIGVAYAVFGVLSLVVARHLRQFRNWARVVVIVLSGIGLLGIPIGTLINGYILYLLLSQKGRRIFEPDYVDIVAATPDIKYRTPMIVWIVLGVLILGIVAAVTVPMFANR